MDLYKSSNGETCIGSAGLKKLIEKSEFTLDNSCESL